MKHLQRVVVPLRVILVLLFAGLLFAQTFSLPGQFAHMAAAGRPELGGIPWLLLGFSILEVLCLQIVLVCIWRLLTLVQADRIFSERSFVWVDVIMWTLVAGWAMLFIVFVSLSAFLYVTPELRDPGLPIVLFGLVLVGGVVVLTMVVMRALLRQAASLQADMEEVI